MTLLIETARAIFSSQKFASLLLSEKNNFSHPLEREMQLKFMDLFERGQYQLGESIFGFRSSRGS
jgi:hypothetical protein